MDIILIYWLPILNEIYSRINFRGLLPLTVRDDEELYRLLDVTMKKRNKSSFIVNIIRYYRKFKVLMDKVKGNL